MITNEDLNILISDIEEESNSGYNIKYHMDNRGQWWKTYLARSYTDSIIVEVRIYIENKQYVLIGTRV